MDNAPRTMVEVRVEFAHRANTAQIAASDPDQQPPDGQKPQKPAYLQGYSNGWKAAHLCAQQVLDTPHDDDPAGLRMLAEALEENKRRVMALTLANIGPYHRSGTVAALDAAATVVRAAQTPAEPAESNAGALPHRTRPPVRPHASEAPVDGEDLSDWSGFPRVPVESVDSFHELALFLGGDVASFTGDLLRLIGRADPHNLNRLAAGFPREVRAYLLWRASAPVTADILVRLLEETAMMRERR